MGCLVAAAMPATAADRVSLDLPAGTERLAATPGCETQGFARGRNILGLQFHPEAGMLPDFERWLIGHSAELAQAGIAPEALRQPPFPLL